MKKPKRKKVESFNRRFWVSKPTTRIKESGKVYSRIKNKKQE